VWESSASALAYAATRLAAAACWMAQLLRTMIWTGMPVYAAALIHQEPNRG